MKKLLLLITTIVLSIALVACDDGSTNTSSNDADETSENDTTNNTNDAEEEEETGSLTVGDTAEFDEMKFTLKSVTTTDERNEFADTEPTAVIKIEYELENNSDEDIPYGAEITVYDAEGNQMEAYPLDNSMGSLAPGKKIQGVEHHGVDAVGTIEIHFDPLLSFEDAAVFEVDVQ